MAKMLTLQNIFFVLLLLVLSILRCESTEDIHGVLYGSTIKQIRENDGTSQNLPTIIEGKIPIDCSKARKNDNAYVTVRVKSSHEDISKLCQNYWQSHYANPAQGYVPPAGPGQFQPYSPMQDPQAPHQFIDPRQPFISPFDTPPQYGSPVTGYRPPLDPLQVHASSRGPYGDAPPMGHQGVLYGAVPQDQQPIPQESVATNTAEGGTQTETNDQLLAEKDEMIQRLNAELEQFRQQLQHGSQVSREPDGDMAATLGRPHQDQSVLYGVPPKDIPSMEDEPFNTARTVETQLEANPESFAEPEVPGQTIFTNTAVGGAHSDAMVDEECQNQINDLQSKLDICNEQKDQLQQELDDHINQIESDLGRLSSHKDYGVPDRLMRDASSLQGVRDSEIRDRGALEQAQEQDFHQLQHSMQDELAVAAQASIQRLNADLDECRRTEQILRNKMEQNGVQEVQDVAEPDIHLTDPHSEQLELRQRDSRASSSIERDERSALERIEELDDALAESQQELQAMEEHQVDHADESQLHTIEALRKENDALHEEIAQFHESQVGAIEPWRGDSREAGIVGAHTAPDTDEVRVRPWRPSGEGIEASFRELQVMLQNEAPSRDLVADQLQHMSQKFEQSMTYTLKGINHVEQELSAAGLVQSQVHDNLHKQVEALKRIQELAQKFTIEHPTIKEIEDGAPLIHDRADSQEMTLTTQDVGPLATGAVVGATGTEPNTDSGAKVLPVHALEDPEAPHRIRDELQRIEGTLTEIVEEINQIEGDYPALESQMDHDEDHEGLDALRRLKEIREGLRQVLGEQYRSR